MANKAPSKKEAKKPKKDAKLNVTAKEPPVPVTVEVVKRKRKERFDEES